MDGGSIVTSVWAAAFWLFLAVVVGSGIWAESRNKREKQRTIRELMSRGDHLDDETVGRLVSMIEGDGRSDARKTREGLEIAYRIVLPISIGLVIMGLFIGQFMTMLGVGALVGCVGVGLMLAAQRMAQMERENSD
jgi:hypothetical protein